MTRDVFLVLPDDKLWKENGEPANRNLCNGSLVVQGFRSWLDRCLRLLQSTMLGQVREKGQSNATQLRVQRGTTHVAQVRTGELRHKGR